MYALLAVLFVVSSLSAYLETDIRSGGTISAKISYNGKPPSPPKLSHRLGSQILRREPG
jgi:hypothetical protein